jgi:kumamolisin
LLHRHYCNHQECPSNRVGNDTAHHPSLVLIGWGNAEGSSTWSQSQMQQVNEQLRLAAVSGITVIVAAGDEGPKNGMTDGRAHADFRRRRGA